MSGTVTAQPGDTPEPTAAAGSRVLLAYFSRAGENYFNGGRTVLQVGNTAVVAEMISSAVAVDVFRIEAADPYPDSYDATVQRNVREQNAEARPAIAGSLPAVGPYDTVLLGSGIWNVRPPMIMRTFVESVDPERQDDLPVRHLRRQRPGPHHRRLNPTLSPIHGRRSRRRARGGGQGRARRRGGVAAEDRTALTVRAQAL